MQHNSLLVYHHSILEGEYLLQFIKKLQETTNQFLKQFSSPMETLRLFKSISGNKLIL